jgi:hypothetical protein
VAHYAPLLWVSLIDLPVEIALASVSGWSFGHYYMLLLPVSAVLVGFFVFVFLTNLRSESIVKAPRVETGHLWMLALLFAMCILPLQRMSQVLPLRSIKKIQDMPVVETEYIKTHTREEDYVLMWGAEARFNFLAERLSPTRFVYQYPLYTPGYQTKGIIDEFLNDIRQKRPLIIDTSSSNARVPPINKVKRTAWTHDANVRLLGEMQDIFAFIDLNYDHIETIGSAKWDVYMPVAD